jgi:hypothetical protein
MELDEVIRKRKMIRKYDNKSRREVLERLISKLIENASKAPSKCRPHPDPGIHSLIKDLDTKKRKAQASFGKPGAGRRGPCANRCLLKQTRLSLSVGRYGQQRGKEFYSIMDGAFASMLILLTAKTKVLVQDL